MAPRETENNAYTKSIMVCYGISGVVNWPIAVPCVPSNNPRNSCRTHFGSSSRLVSEVASDLVTKPL